MSYTKDYYAILSLRPPTLSNTDLYNHHNGDGDDVLPSAELRKAYRLALLAAHPDKMQKTEQQQKDIKNNMKNTHTIDDVKEAYSILSDRKASAEYNRWRMNNPGIIAAGGEQEWDNDGVEQRGHIMLSSDFVLGLEVLDLSDFDVLDPGFEFSVAEGAVGGAGGNGNGNGVNGVVENGDGDKDGDVDMDMDTSHETPRQMEWTRACRCGADKGFRILEEELEDAEARGEKEVLVGCEGCSLWVRVGFEVEFG